ncbi:hypothetical protein FOCG_18036 [Fusarium oxysporum f. sp. radicis-lycopersici 26381]|nr:hypothetical protein FOCG_18036 [Fusarium oxysporum f. sp. radicis-lycopersici 26381]
MSTLFLMLSQACIGSLPASHSERMIHPQIIFWQQDCEQSTGEPR